MGTSEKAEKFVLFLLHTHILTHSIPKRGSSNLFWKSCIVLCWKCVFSRAYVCLYCIFKEFACSRIEYTKGKLIANSIGNSWICAVCNFFWTISTSLYTAFSFRFMDHPRMNARQVNVFTFLSAS